MNERVRVVMDDTEVAAMLHACRKVQIATINRDGTPHLVTMFYGVRDGRIAFWTYRASQKARNLVRDPRVTCLVEAGDDYFALRGVQVNGVVECIEDAEGVLDIGRLIAARLPGLPAEVLEEYVVQAARKRVAFLVAPRRVVSWDHRRLLT